VAQASPQRKALRGAFRLVGLGFAAAIVSFPISFIGTLLMNPLLGRLEARYGVELTGHSGPADWVFALVFGVTTIALFAALVLLTRGGQSRRPTADARDVTL
jgi:hypothetical protein